MDGWPKAKISLYSCEKQVKSILEVWFLQIFDDISHTLENILYYLVSTNLKITVFRFIAFINTKYLLSSKFSKGFSKIYLTLCTMIIFSFCEWHAIIKEQFQWLSKFFFLMIPRHGKKKKKGTSCHFFHNQ